MPIHDLTSQSPWGIRGQSTFYVAFLFSIAFHAPCPMARQVHIQFAGAVYHCMARGDRREPIVEDDADRDAFAGLLEELVARTGFEVFAWVLMDNHYHLVFKTRSPTWWRG